MAPRIFLFDIDGTLIRTGGAAADALDQALGELFGLRGGMKQVSPAGKTDPLIVREIFALLRPDHALERAEIDAALARYVEILKDVLPQAPRFRVLPGLPALLERLLDTGEALLGLATGNVEAGGRLKLARGGLDGYFAFGGFADDAEARSELVARAARRGREAAGEDVPAGRIFVVGDTPHDIAAARAAGVRVIAVATGPHGREELARHGPDLLVETLEETERILELAGL